MAKKQKEKEAVPVQPVAEATIGDKEMLAKAKEEGGIPDPGVEIAASVEEPIVEPKVEEKPTKSQAQIEAEIDAFLGTLTPKVKSKEKMVISADVKSADGKTPEELIAEGRNAEAMELVATKVAKKEREAAMAEIQGNQVQQEFTNKRIEANRKVYMAHPELLEIDKGLKKPQEVPFAQTISQVYNEYPNLLQTPEGPLMAMEIAEKRLGFSKTEDTSKQAGQSAVKAEQARQDASRASAAIASSSSSGRPPAPEVGDYNLSDDERIVAGRMGLTDVEYGKMRERKTVFGPEYYAKHRGGPRPRRG